MIYSLPIVINIILLILLWKNLGKMENNNYSIHEKDIPFMQFAFGEDYIQRTKLEALDHWNAKYGHDLKIEDNQDINYSLDKMHEYYTKVKK